MDWFNAVDATYRSELRQEIATLKVELLQAIAEVKTELGSEIAARHSDLLKWMFLYWAGTALTVIGLLKL